MAIVALTSATANGATAGVTVAESRCYSVQVMTQQAAITIEGSVDGTNYFPIGDSVRFDSNAGGTLACAYVDRPVQKVRLYVSGYVSGTITGTVITT